jgi:hypothetical protein
MSYDQRDVPQRSVYDQARFEAWKHKWLVSEYCCRDRGMDALLEWNHKYWIPFLRYCLFEHMSGTVFYREFGDRYFRHIELIPRHDQSSYDFVLSKFMVDSWENMCFVTKCSQHGYDFDQLFPVLQMLPVNETRLDPPDWSNCAVVA